MRASNPYPRELPTTQTISVKMGEFGVLCSRWSAFWTPRNLEPRPRRRQSREFRYTSFRSSHDSPRAGRQSGGISLHELLTRRRHAARGLRVAKTPSPPRHAAQQHPQQQGSGTSARHPATTPGASTRHDFKGRPTRTASNAPAHHGRQTD